MLVSIVVVGLVPYYAIDPDTPISSAFADHGMQWAAYIINAGACTALCSALMGGILPQPRILMAMARDGLLPPFLCDINRQTLVPVKGTILTGLAAAVLAFSMEVSELAGMVSVGTLLAFTMVAISLLILRYIPPNKVPMPPSLQDSIVEINVEYVEENISTSEDTKPLNVARDFPIAIDTYLNEGNRRRVVEWTIAFICLGAFVLTYAASCLTLSSVRFALCGVGGILLVSGFVFLTCIDQDEARHNFGHSGGFVCPFVPLLPIACILINSYLLINLGVGTWLRVSVWLVIGLLIYVFYGRTHSSLKDAIYVPVSQVDQTYQAPRSYLA
jgi:cationic amino acid transporter 1